MAQLQHAPNARLHGDGHRHSGPNRTKGHTTCLASGLQHANCWHVSPSERASVHQQRKPHHAAACPGGLGTQPVCIPAARPCSSPHTSKAVSCHAIHGPATPITPQGQCNDRRMGHTPSNQPVPCSVPVQGARTRTRRGVACSVLDQPKQGGPLATQPEGGYGVYVLMLLNVIVFLLDKVLHLPMMQSLYLNHSYPQAWQWVSHMFCHANWGHISNNLFLLLTFGRLVEDIEGPWGVSIIYVLCGLGAAVASFLLSSRATVSLGASGAIFGLFAVSVLMRISSFNLKRLLESVVLGQFVVRQVWTELTQQLSGGLVVGGLHVSHLAHLGGAMAGVLLVMALQRVPKGEENQS